MADTQIPMNANDGTLEGAVAAMSDAAVDPAALISFEEAANRDAGLPPPDEMARFAEKVEAEKLVQPRAPDGKFTKEQPAPEPEAKAAEASDLAEEFFELPPEKDGEAPRRISAKEVFDGYQERDVLRHELEQARRQQPPPVEWDRQMLETVQQRTKLVQTIQQLEHLALPAEPDLSLIDENSPRYDPGAYQRQAAAYKAAQSRMTEFQRLRSAHEEQLQQEQSALLEAKKVREQGKLLDMWPEIRDPATQRQVVDEAARYYGITQQDFATTHDARLYAILKDALAFRASQNQRQAAVKVVRSVPKLVKAQARDTRAPAARVQAGAMQRLAQTGSVEDAALAIGGLLG
jgi:hypothetical protein